MTTRQLLQANSKDIIHVLAPKVPTKRTHVDLTDWVPSCFVQLPNSSFLKQVLNDVN